jgi:hypothetical protein
LLGVASAIPPIATDEHRERQQRTREAAAERRLDAVVAFSRGGGTHDRTADVLATGSASAGSALDRPGQP